LLRGSAIGFGEGDLETKIPKGATIGFPTQHCLDARPNHRPPSGGFGFPASLVGKITTAATGKTRCQKHPLEESIALILSEMAVLLGAVWFIFFRTTVLTAKIAKESGTTFILFVLWTVRNGLVGVRKGMIQRNDVVSFT
jgi:hypothetical protein